MKYIIFFDWKETPKELDTFIDDWKKAACHSIDYVTILIDLVKPARGVMIYDTAELDYGEIRPTAITICEKYMSKEKAKSFAEDIAENVMDLTVSVKPERMITFHF